MYSFLILQILVTKALYLADISTYKLRKIGHFNHAYKCLIWSQHLTVADKIRGEKIFTTILHIQLSTKMLHRKRSMQLSIWLNKRLLKAQTSVIKQQLYNHTGNGRFPWKNFIILHTTAYLWSPSFKLLYCFLQNHRLLLSATTLPSAWEVSWMGCLNTANPTGSGNKQLSD